ncbi:MAG: putative nudix hydrolase YeaB [Oceanicaulis sp. HLUCCA04]|nr:MAG: putative nudix hydrolase YeaB [Oceanicaulis sp. HLUCCA04]
MLDDPFHVNSLVERLSRALDPVDGRPGEPLRGDGDLNGAPSPTGRALRPAAVLAPLVMRKTGLSVVFTRRADHLSAHAGQISFPGGRLNVGENPVDAALRESEEEIGLLRSQVRLIGQFDPYETVTGFQITPFVGLVDPAAGFRADPGEVAEIFETPFDFLMNPANHVLEERMFAGQLRRYYAMPHEGRYIWGATAGLLKALADRFNASR